ncbi:MAG: 2TM domain-containing protein [Ginsengibacter sp.]
MEKEIKDPGLWRMSQKRAAFKYHVLIYFIINLLFWTMWYIQLRNNATPYFERDVIPWPVWPMMGWGIGLIFHYLSAYTGNEKFAEKEYEKLKNKKL